MAYTTINKSSDFFNALLWSGNGSDNRVISGVGFQPDWIWWKQRTGTNGHGVIDAVRGTSGTNYTLATNNTSAEFDWSSIFKNIQSDGYTVGTDSAINQSGQTYVGWNWKANGAGSSNTDGSINTTYTSVNTTAGFSISKYTGNGTGGATIGHGLGSVPHMYIVKRLDAGSSNWHVYHQSIGATKGLKLNLTNAESTSDIWQDTAPTSSVFSLGSSVDVNASGGTYIAYCFAEKTGYSKFGSYTGNGNADGTFVYTGFKPAFVIIKQSSGSGTSWNIWDNKRLGYNTKNYQLEANTTGVENTSLERLLITSNGFKCITDNAQINGSGNTYIYMCFGQSLVGSNNVPCTAR